MNMTSPKVSIIVPVYNVEQYIERCVRSVFEQTLENIEFVFIDDCTPDNSINIIRHVLLDYPERCEQVKIISLKENKGLPNARKTGIDNAKGEYIVHCDSDDWMEKDFCEKMYTKAIKESADVVICNFYISTDFDNKYSLLKKVHNKEDLLFTNVAMWQKMIRKNLYDNIIYPEYNMWEDRLFTVQLMYYANNVTYVDEPLYHYYVNQNSICRNNSVEQSVKRFSESYNNLISILDFIKSINFNDSSIYINDLKYQVLILLAPATVQNEYFILWKSIFPEIHDAPYRCKTNFSQYVRYILTYYHVFPFLKKIKRYLFNH